MRRYDGVRLCRSLRELGFFRDCNHLETSRRELLCASRPVIASSRMGDAGTSAIHHTVGVTNVMSGRRAWELGRRASERTLQVGSWVQLQACYEFRTTTENSQLDGASEFSAIQQAAAQTVRTG